jgi:hypothetical protein
VLGGVAVLDNETGIVWERAPDAATRDWDTAYRFCAQRVLGGRQGWRLPVISELMSLFDGTALPAGHPFTTGAIPSFWSASPSGASSDMVYVAFFANGTTDTRATAVTVRTWCVRGGAEGAAVERRDDPFGSWSSLLSTGSNPLLSCASERFQCVMNGEAVLDNETGLVWEIAPPTAEITWDTAHDQCLATFIGGRQGWRLPRVEEIRSLLVPTGLPANSPFGFTTGEFWTSTTYSASDPSFMNVVRIESPGAQIGVVKTLLYRRWCVRGGAGMEGP